MITTDYNQQAIDFLNQTGTTFKAVFEKYDYYFDEDKKRNIFKILLKNSKHKYAFRFGSSIKDSTKNSDQIIYEKEIDFYCGFEFKNLKNKYLSYSDKISIAEIKKNFINKNDLIQLINKEKASQIYNDFINRNKAPTYFKSDKPDIFSLERWIKEIEQRLIKKAEDLKNKNFGEGIPNDSIIYPSAYDVLACLQKYDVGSFKDFCGDFGYDEDSRKAYKTYKAVLKEWKNIELLFTPGQIELLQEIN